jgi:hypothetical protein
VPGVWAIAAVRFGRLQVLHWDHDSIRVPPSQDYSNSTSATAGSLTKFLYTRRRQRIFRVPSSEIERNKSSFSPRRMSRHCRREERFVNTIGGWYPPLAALDFLVDEIAARISKTSSGSEESLFLALQSPNSAIILHHISPNSPANIQQRLAAHDRGGCRPHGTPE